MPSPPPFIIALDFPTVSEALNLVKRLDPSLCHVKVGKALFTQGGPKIIEHLLRLDYKVFLDLKFHDIPNTVAAACRAAAELGVWMIDVHACGGKAMLEAARNSLEKFSQRPLLIAVTVLTSLTEADLSAIGVTDKPADQVLRLARLAQSAGVDGVVCSAHEVRDLRKNLGKSFCLVTPGIRPAGWGNADDQHRIMTPREALVAGSDYLVIGRPITKALDPLQALQSLHANLIK
jgi:orotidine-5'-phosphate decarboxylase